MKKQIFLFCFLLLFAFLIGCEQVEQTDYIVFPEEEEQFSQEFCRADYAIGICAVMGKDDAMTRQLEYGFFQRATELGYTDLHLFETDELDPFFLYDESLAFAKEGGKALFLIDGLSTCVLYLEDFAKYGMLVGVPHFTQEEDDGRVLNGILFNITEDAKEYGTCAAKAMKEAVKGKSGCIALSIEAENDWQDAMIDGFIEEWKNNQGDEFSSLFLLEPTGEEGIVLDKAAKINAERLRENPAIIAAFGAGTYSALAWAEAEKQVGREDLTIIGTEIFDETIKAVETGEIYALVVPSLTEEGERSMDYFDQLFQGKEVPSKTKQEILLVAKDGTGIHGISYWDTLFSEIDAYFLKMQSE